MKVLAAASVLLLASGCASADGPALPEAVPEPFTSCPPPGELDGYSAAYGELTVVVPPTPDLPFAPGAPPADFAAVEVVVCDVVDAGDEALVDERRSTDVAGLLAALDTESGVADFCNEYATIVPWFALLDADGDAVRPVLPTDGCHPLDEVIAEIPTGAPVVHSRSYTRDEASGPVDELVRQPR